MDTVVRVSEPRELLAYVPFRLGFHPAWSVVLVSLQPVRGGRSRVGLVVRVDLDDLADAETGLALARSLAGHLRADGAADVLTVLYVALPVEEVDGYAPWRRASAHLRGALWWVRTRQVWVVTPTRYAHLGCDECVSRPVGDLSGTRIGAEMVLQGAGVLPAREDLAVRPSPAGPERTAALRGARREARRRPRPPSAGPEDLQAWRVTGSALWEDLCRTRRCGGTNAPGDLGRMAAFLQDRTVRDAVVCSVMAGGGTGTAVDHLDPGAVGRTFLSGGRPARPEAGVALQVLTDVAALSARGAAAPALGALAYLAWWLGDGARADVLVGQCLTEEPTHQLGLLVRRALDAGLPPVWVRREPSEE